MVLKLVIEMGEEADADWQVGLVEWGMRTTMPKLVKLRIQAQHLQPGDIVGSREKVFDVMINSIHWPSNKVHIALEKDGKTRSVLWGKYTMINIQREG